MTTATVGKWNRNIARWLNVEELVEYLSEDIEPSPNQATDSMSTPSDVLISGSKQHITNDMLLAGFLVIAGFSFVILGVVLQDIYYAGLGVLGSLGGLFHFRGD